MNHITKATFLGMLLFTGVANAVGTTPARYPISPDLDRLTVLESRKMTDNISLQVIRDSKGRIFRQRVANGESPKPLPSSPLRTSGNNQGTVFYEGFEGYQTSYGINWIPEDWTEINSPHHVPTPEALSHNVNNSWYVYFTSDMFQAISPDGECEAFIHFPYDGGYGSSDDASDEWLVSPSIEIGDNQTLSFLHQGDTFAIYSYDWNTGKFDRSRPVCNMLAMLSEDDGENWTEIWNFAENELQDKTDDYLYSHPLEYVERRVSLSPWAGKTVKIAFRYICDGGGWEGCSMMIDGVKVYSNTTSDPGTDPDWTYLGEGSMADGWIIPALTGYPGTFYDPADYVFTVEISQNKSNPGLYKLHSPYTSEAFPFLNLNGNSEPYDIIIDATDPQFVLVAPQISGFEHNSPGALAARYAAPYYISCAGQYFYDEGNSPEDITAYGYNSTFDVENGRIVINTPQYGHMEDGELDMGYACSNTENYPTVITLPFSEPAPQWESIGMGTFEDGFLCPGFFGDPALYRWEVEFLAKSDEPGVYMIKNPYITPTSPFYAINAVNDGDVLIKVDASNPDFVYIEPQGTGFYSSFQGDYSEFYIGNIAGMYYLWGNSKELIETVLTGEDVDTMTDDIITVHTPLFGSDPYDGFGYNWIDAEGQPIIYAAKLYLPSAEQPGPEVGVNDVEVTDSAQPVYYDLQGVEISAPRAGQIVIVKRGDKATREIFRK